MMEIIKSVVQAPGVLKEIYGDLAKPGAQQVGKALSTVLGLGNTILWPIALLNEKSKIALETNLNKFRERLESVPEEEVCEVTPEIGVPVAEKLAYVTNEELSNMYIELLANASKISNTNVAHPSFVNIINNISPDEAIFLQSLKNMEGGFPFIEVRKNIRGKSEWKPLNPMIPGVLCLADLQYPQNIAAYISNLEGLGIFQVKTDRYMVGEGIYEPLIEYAMGLYKLNPSEESEFELAWQRGKVEITPFARLLMRACFNQ